MAFRKVQQDSRTELWRSLIASQSKLSPSHSLSLPYSSLFHSRVTQERRERMFFCQEIKKNFFVQLLLLRVNTRTILGSWYTLRAPGMQESSQGREQEVTGIVANIQSASQSVIISWQPVHVCRTWCKLIFMMTIISLSLWPSGRNIKWGQRVRR